MSKLFSPFALRDLTLRNRTVIAPMCQYSAIDGLANDWHFAHLSRFALGGFGLVILEATGVTAEGRISYADLGLWNDSQVAPLKRIVDFMHSQHTAAGIQLAHAGRKASTSVPFHKGLDPASVGYQHWTPVAPSAIAHSDNPDFQTPTALDQAGLDNIVSAFADAARRADTAGFDTVEIHAAHGYLLNQFLSPLANKRTDNYGGTLENRMRLPLAVVEAVRAAWPEGKPLLVRISTSDNAEGGWQVEDSVIFSKALKALGVDLVHCSSGGFAEGTIKPEPLYQVAFAKAVRDGAGIPTAAVGLINTPQEAEDIVESGEADIVAFARAALDDPNWALHAQQVLDAAAQDYTLWPAQAGARIKDRDRVLHIRGFAA